MANRNQKLSYWLALAFVVLSLLLYGLLAYDLDRTNHIKLLIVYGALFFLHYKIITCKTFGINFLIGFSIAFRLVFLLSIPNLSQDFYRFIWDGRMILEGFNPYLYTPLSQMETSLLPIRQAFELVEGMGALSAGHFTNYPPVSQFCFVIAGILSGKSILGSVIVLRLLIIAADLGTFYFGRKLMRQLNFDDRQIFWFILNPLIVLELSGNLHFEGVMIFFLVWSLYLLYNGKYLWSAVVLALSISTKLIPLMFLPLYWGFFMNYKIGVPLKNEEHADNIRMPVEAYPEENAENTIQKLGLAKLIKFYAITAIATLAMFLPFLSTEFLTNYAHTVGLWFQKFEFNASIYYVIREIGYTFRGYNEIAIIGKWTACATILFILYTAFFRKGNTMPKLITNMLLVLSFYLFTTTTVHPWYIATLLILAVFTKFKFAWVWSAMIMLSYLAYNTFGFKEYAWVLLIEYLIVYAVFFKEIWNKDKVESMN